jgi:hypothetical protein
MSEGLVAAVWRAYGDPRGAMTRQIAAGLSEPRAFAHLYLACALGFVASMPVAVRSAATLDGVPDPLTGTIAAHLFGYLVVAPLVMYGLAALLHLAARAAGGRGGFLGARAALFWSAMLGGPIALALALTGVAAELVAGPGPLPWLGYLGYAGLGFWLWLLAAGFAAAEGFAGTRGVAAALALALAGLAIGVGALSRAAVTAG